MIHVIRLYFVAPQNSHAFIAALRDGGLWRESVRHLYQGLIGFDLISPQFAPPNAALGVAASPDVAVRRRFAATTVRSSRAVISWHGCWSGRSNCATSSRASRHRTRMRRASTSGCERSACG